eukprot:CAMPEP_0173297080 /NCGR_PEP_ID=MMETSP1143-20121109/15312_1 /TAXON_ID=483371 /ORGANISM="non described non described, Strain CCMP2298" /LENGTH=136 /DNA_ID=CAMNT_0014236993 /DNA_START=42 /DNA_END=449 /DNA_ORIENTATION=-
MSDPEMCEMSETEEFFGTDIDFDGMGDTEMPEMPDSEAFTSLLVNPGDGSSQHGNDRQEDSAREGNSREGGSGKRYRPFGEIDMSPLKGGVTRLPPPSQLPRLPALPVPPILGKLGTQHQHQQQEVQGIQGIQGIQ